MHWNYYYSFLTGFSISISAAPPSTLILLHNWGSPGISKTQLQYSLLSSNPLGLPFCFLGGNEMNHNSSAQLQKFVYALILSFHATSQLDSMLPEPVTLSHPLVFATHCIYSPSFIAWDASYSLFFLTLTLVPRPHFGTDTYAPPNTSTTSTNTISVTHTYSPRKH